MWSIDWSLLVVAITFVFDGHRAGDAAKGAVNALRAELKDNVQSVHKEMKGGLQCVHRCRETTSAVRC